MPISKGSGQNVLEIAAAVRRGDLSLRQGIERFVRLVMSAQVPFRVPSEIVEIMSDAIATDTLLGARFAALFRRLGRAPRR